MLHTVSAGIRINASYPPQSALPPKGRYRMLIFHDIAMVLMAAVVGGLLFWRLRQPPILGYVLAGLIVSPLTPG